MDAEFNYVSGPYLYPVFCRLDPKPKPLISSRDTDTFTKYWNCANSVGLTKLNGTRRHTSDGMMRLWHRRNGAAGTDGIDGTDNMPQSTT